MNKHLQRGYPSRQPASGDLLGLTQRRDDTLKGRLVVFYRRHPRLVVASVLTVLLVLLLWRPQSYGIPTEVVGVQYSVVVDAGSTGSRIHAYRFGVENSGELVLQSDDFHQLKPGLSAFAGRPVSAARSLLPLFRKIQSTIPWGQRAETPCQLRATAGLRFLPGNQADDILEAVQTQLQETEYSVGPGAVSVLDGSYEGAYAWLTLNYLLEKLEGKDVETVSAIDLGGGSVQESYEVLEPQLSDQQPRLVTVQNNGQSRSLYVHSYLSYGLMAARALVLNGTKAGEDNPCLAQGYEGEYVYNGQKYAAVNKRTVSVVQCQQMARHVLKLNTACGAPIEECTFNGVWGGPISRSRNTRPVYLFSYFWDRAMEVGIIPSAEMTNWQMQTHEYAAHSRKICEKSLAALKEEFPSIDAAHLPYLCLDLCYISALLSEGFKMDPNETVYLAKKINYRGEFIETSWTLGAALDSMSSA